MAPSSIEIGIMSELNFDGRDEWSSAEIRVSKKQQFMMTVEAVIWLLKMKKVSLILDFSKKMTAAMTISKLLFIPFIHN